MGPDLDLHPDAVHRLSGLARNAAEILDAPVPEPPLALGPGAVEVVQRLARSVRLACDELATFATVAETVARRAVGTDQVAAGAVRSAVTEPAGTEPAGIGPVGTEPAGREPAGTEPGADPGHVGVDRGAG